jgi:hypothetical protein
MELRLNKRIQWKQVLVFKRINMLFQIVYEVATVIHKRQSKNCAPLTLTGKWLGPLVVGYITNATGN